MSVSVSLLRKANQKGESIGQKSQQWASGYYASCLTYISIHICIWDCYMNFRVDGIRLISNANLKDEHQVRITVDFELAMDMKPQY